MAGPSKVEFPGQKKNQRMRMRGTKQASVDAQKRLRKQLSSLLDEPEKVIVQPRSYGFCLLLRSCTSSKRLRVLGNTRVSQLDNYLQAVKQSH